MQAGMMCILEGLKRPNKSLQQSPKVEVKTVNAGGNSAQYKVIRRGC
jgi:hypothetical protein